MAANVAQILIELRQRGDRVLNGIESGMRRVNQVSKTYRDTLSGTNAAAGQLTGTLTRLVGVIGTVDIYRRAVASAFKFNDTLEQSRIGIAALVRSFNDFADAQGNAVDAQTAYILSMGMASRIQTNLQIAGLKTIATYEQLLRVMQEGLGPAFKAGFNPDQVVKFTSQMVQAGAALSVPMEQMGQEIRAILDGTIDRNARIAMALGITNAQIKELIKSGTVFEFLSAKLKEFERAGEDAAKTFTGAASNLTDAIQMALGRGLESTFKNTTKLLLDLQKSIVTIDEAAGTFTFNEKIVSALERVDQAIVSLFGNTQNMNEWVERAATAFANVAVAALRALDVLVKLVNVFGPWLPEIAQAVVVLGLFKVALSVLIGIPLTIASHLMAMAAALKVLFAAQILSGLAGLRTALAAVGASAGAAAIAFRATLAAAAAYAAYQIGQLIVATYQWISSVNKLKKAQAEAAANKDFIDPKIADKLKSVSDATGLAITNMAEFNKLVKEGSLIYDQAAKRWVKGAGAGATMTPKPKVDEEAMKDVAEDQKRLEEQLANDLVKISGDKWTVLKNQAKKHYEDQVKLAHGNNDLIEKAKQVLAGNLAEIDREQAETQGKTSRKAAEAAISDQKEIQTAIIQSQVTRMRAATETALARLDDVFERGEMAVKEYFARRRELIEEEFQAEVDALRKQLSLETDVAAQLRIQDEIFTLQEQHKRDLIDLTKQQAEAEKKVADNAEQVKKILSDMSTRTLQKSPVLGDQFTAELVQMDQMHGEEIKRLKDLRATEDQINDAFRRQQLEKDKLLAEQQKRLWEYRLNAAQTVASGISQVFTDLYELTGKKNKEFFAIAKAAALAEAIVNGALAITKALAQGGMWGMAQAAVIAAMTGVQIAKIQAQQLAFGGPVHGRSPHKRADNVPILATAGEWVHPVDTVQYYGARVMEALRRRLIPKELFAGFAVPLPSMGPQFAFADGGQVPAGSGAGFVVNVPVSVTGARDAEKLGRVLPGEIERTVIRVMRDQLR